MKMKKTQNSYINISTANNFDTRVTESINRNEAQSEERKDQESRFSAKSIMRQESKFSKCSIESIRNK